MPDNTRSVLITGAGAPGIRGTIYALHQNPDGVKIRTVGTDARADAAGRFLVDRFYQVPAPEGPQYLDSLLSICRSEGVEVVIPQTSRETVLLSRHRAEFQREKIHVMVSDPAAIEVANNKWKLLQVFCQLGLPHPRFRLVTTERELVAAVRRLGYPEKPVVVRPTVSNGMRGLRVLKEDAWDLQRFLGEKPAGLEISLDDLLRILRRGTGWPELLITEYLPGPEYSVDAFVGGDVGVAVPRLRKEIRSGISFENTLEYRDDLMEYTLKAAQHIGLRYAVGFQFKLDEEGVPKVLECNPRVQGTMVASVFSGVNVIWLAFGALLGAPMPELPPVLRPAAFYRFWGGLGVSEDSVDEI